MSDRFYTLHRFVVLFALILVGCGTPSTSQPTIQDYGLLSKTPCPAPCFYGIYPGSTTLSEAESILSSAGLCSQPLYVHSTPGEPERIHCDNGIYLSTDSNKVVMRLVAYNPQEPLTVGTVVDQLGYPDAVMVNTYTSGEEYRSLMSLYFQKEFTRLILSDQEGAVFRLDQDTPVDTIVYCEKGFFEEQLELASPWAGFGAYKDK